MATIVIELDPHANQSKLIEAIEMLRGVKKVIPSDPETEFLARKMNLSRKSGKGDKSKVMDFLSK